MRGLFRAKTLYSESKFVYGFYVAEECNNGTRHVIFENGKEVYWCDGRTVGEFTGACDKNGTKIFEGDIIQVITGDTGKKRQAEVKIGKFIDCNAGDNFIGVYIEFDGLQVSILQEDGEILKHGEVIGNIHDNPGLLGEGGQ